MGGDQPGAERREDSSDGRSQRDLSRQPVQLRDKLMLREDKIVALSIGT
jgi:hypothetical protein